MLLTLACVSVDFELSFFPGFSFDTCIVAELSAPKARARSTMGKNMENLVLVTGRPVCFAELDIIVFGKYSTDLSE